VGDGVIILCEVVRLAGRKSKYESHVQPKLFLVECWARDGLTDEQMAKKLGISKDSFYKYKSDFPEFSDSLKKGKEIVDYEVENALLKRALGYDYCEEKVEVETTPDGVPISRKVVQILKHVVPDTTAQIMWLNNRRPDKFRRNAGKEKLDEERLEHDKDIDGKKYF
jgi:hypothetical protein